jgi:hypothetical protein
LALRGRAFRRLFRKRHRPAEGVEGTPLLVDCSFCGRSQREVRQIIAGPAVFICDECVDVCVETLAGKRQDQRITRAIDMPREHAEAVAGLASGLIFAIEDHCPQIELECRLDYGAGALQLTIDLRSQSDRRTVERALDDLGLVVLGVIEPEDFAESPDAAARLRYRLHAVLGDVAAGGDATPAPEREEDWIPTDPAARVRIFRESFAASLIRRDVVGLEKRVLDGQLLDDGAMEAYRLVATRAAAVLRPADEDDVKAALATVRNANPVVHDQLLAALDVMLSRPEMELLSQWTAPSARLMPD